MASFNRTVHVNKDKLVSVRQAALEINAANKLTVNRCKCRGEMQQCIVLLHQMRYPVFNHCHSGRSCQNIR